MISHKGNAGRSKHIQLRYNTIRECVAQAITKVIYCPTTLIIADTLTKPLGQPLFSIHQTRLLNLSRPTVSVIPFLTSVFRKGESMLNREQPRIHY